jgi:hypothetical protein
MITLEVEAMSLWSISFNLPRWEHTDKGAPFIVDSTQKEMYRKLITDKGAPFIVDSTQKEMYQRLIEDLQKHREILMDEDDLDKIDAKITKLGTRITSIDPEDDVVIVDYKSWEQLSNQQKST